MSAFICNDKHIASLTNWYTTKTHKVELNQTIANKLKQVNIESVNYRYDESTPIEKCKLDIMEITNEIAYNMARCLRYQSWEKPDYLNPLLKEIEELAYKLRDHTIYEDIWELV